MEEKLDQNIKDEEDHPASGCESWDETQVYLTVKHILSNSLINMSSVSSI